MTRLRVSFRVAPGVRITASDQGLRTSVGNSSARVSPDAKDAYASAKDAYGTGSVRMPRRYPTDSGTARGRALRASIAQLERAQKAGAFEAQIDKIAAIERELVTLHQEEFVPAKPRCVTPPLRTDADALSLQWQRRAIAGVGFFDRAARREARARADLAARAEAAKVDAENHRQYQRRQAAADEWWRRLSAHNPETVIVALDHAFADNASEVTCVDAGIDEERAYATIVIVFGPASAIPDRALSVTPGGKPTTKKRTKTERNALYVRALGSTVLATVKKAFAVAPALTEVRMLVLRRDPNASAPADCLAVIYQAAFGRAHTCSLPWDRIDPAEQLLAASHANLQRKGATRDLAAIRVDDPALAQLVSTFADALRARP